MARDQNRSGRFRYGSIQQRVTASTLRQYSISLRLAIAHAAAKHATSISSDGLLPDAHIKHSGGSSAWTNR